MKINKKNGNFEYIELPCGKSRILSLERSPMHSILVSFPTGAHIRLNSTFLMSSTAILPLKN